MIPDLGAYAGAVLGAYGVTLALLGALVLVSALRGAEVRRALARLEDGAGASRDARPARAPASALLSRREDRRERNGDA